MSQGPEEPVLPEQTRDDSDEGGDWRDRDEDIDRDAWMERERPPHWE